MRVGILGGGMQGCCCALALAERGVDVTLFDRNSQLLSRTAVANEGKIHLGYMYANDPSYRTARMMMNGALAFAPFFARHLEVTTDSLNVSQPASYVVHSDSQRSTEEVSGYLATVHTMIIEAAEGRPQDYFGRDLSQTPQPWPSAKLESEFDCRVVSAAYESPEVAINPVVLAEALRQRINSDRRIKIRLAHEVLSVENVERPTVVVRDPSRLVVRRRFDHVINALWDGRLAVDEGLGLRPVRPWLHRLKYGVGFYAPGHARKPPSATFVSGPLGEVVTYRDGLIYLTWYPTCLRGISSDVKPPEWPTYPNEPLHSDLLRDTLSSMAQFVISLRELVPEELVDVTVKGGVIVAWGETDIYDPNSELHRRYEIGITSNRRYHSVDPGKLTMAPYFAGLCADGILD